MWRDWFTFSRQDRRAIILLAVLIIVALMLLWAKPMWHREEVTVSLGTDSVAMRLALPSSQQPIVKIELRPFNPNTADSLELLSVGFPPRVARNILRYRKAGGEFRRSEDLARIYGLHDSVFTRIMPYIAIPKPAGFIKEKLLTDESEPLPIMLSSDTMQREHPYAEYMRAKHKSGQFVDLNRADTSELMKIPGIGPVYAKMIVDYRERLGGYHNIVQIRDLEVLPEDLGDWVHVSTPPTAILNVNNLSLTQLRSHPYLSFYQAKAIVELRKREGHIRSVRQLLFLDEFSESDIERLTPYLSFD